MKLGDTKLLKKEREVLKRRLEGKIKKKKK